MHHIRYSSLFSRLLLAAALALAPAAPAYAAETPTPHDADYTLTGPFAAENLKMFFVHGPNRVDSSTMLTLDEAIDRKAVEVREVGSVNELTVRNLSPDKSVLLQAGEIVKGGRQDRVLSSDLLLPPKSKTVSLEAFCVEHGRWEQRGRERADRFTSSNNRLASKELKVAAIAEKRQDKVWEEVEKAQAGLAAKVKKPVKSESSPTSLQLSLEDTEVRKVVADYRAKLEPAAAGSDTLGFVAVVGGAISSGEVYASHDLFMRAWPKLIDAAAGEAAIGEHRIISGDSVDEAQVRSFIASAEQAPVDSTAKVPHVSIRSSKTSYFSETGSGKAWVHRSYLAR